LGADNAGVVFLMMKSLGSGWLKSISSRDLMVVWIDDVERLQGMLMFMDVYGYFRHQISRT
jgi:hypothetical protein